MITLVAFEAGGAKLAVEVHLVVEVMPDEPLSPLPAGPAFLEGLRVIRGRVLPVMDLGRRFGRASVAGRPETRVLWIELPRGPVGFRVERVGGLVKCPESSVLPTEGSLSGIPAAYVKGVVRRPEGTLLWLDPERLLSAAEHEALGSVAKEPSS